MSRWEIRRPDPAISKESKDAIHFSLSFLFQNHPLGWNVIEQPSSLWMKISADGSLVTRQIQPRRLTLVRQHPIFDYLGKHCCQWYWKTMNFHFESGPIRTTTQRKWKGWGRLVTAAFISFPILQPFSYHERIFRLNINNRCNKNVKKEKRTEGNDTADFRWSFYSWSIFFFVFECNKSRCVRVPICAFLQQSQPIYDSIHSKQK